MIIKITLKIISKWQSNFSFSLCSQADEDSGAGEESSIIIKKDRDMWIALEYCGT